MTDTYCKKEKKIVSKLSQSQINVCFKLSNTINYEKQSCTLPPPLLTEYFTRFIWEAQMDFKPPHAQAHMHTLSVF